MPKCSFPKLTLALTSLFLLPSAAPADLVVLQYHHVSDDTPPSTSTSPDLFREQLALIKKLDLEVVPLREGLQKALKGDTSTPVVALTFDDAYSSIYETAWPLIREHGWSLTLFVNAEAVDEGRQGYMDWDQLREMSQADSVTIGNHSFDHDHLVPLPGESAAAFRARFQNSALKGQARLTEALGVTPRLFAYPYGEYNTVVQEWMRDQGWKGFGQQSGAIGASSDTTALPRFPASNTYGKLDTLETKLRARAFPIDYHALPDPVFDRNPPQLELTLPSEWQRERLACYGSGRGRLKIQGEQQRVRVHPNTPFESRRFRYNCTYPAENGRFFWLSQPWVDIRASRD
ncbi:polysaccharide deacetylase family protein [Marinobacteraceae bacterium S3BR75-40.1]